MSPWFFQLPLELRAGLFFVLGLLVGTQINRGIYRLAWNARWIGPWSPPHPKAPRRRWEDFLPVVGWFGLAREAPIHGGGYWIRPALLELATGGIFAGVYAWEVTGRLTPPPPLLPLGLAPSNPIAGPTPEALHAMALAHLLLFSLMLVATFIDLDEKTVPDAITTPGTLLALIWMAVAPSAGLPVFERIADQWQVTFLKMTAPQVDLSVPDWPPWLSGPGALAIGLLLYLGWVFAVSDKVRWKLLRRVGIGAFFVYMLESLCRGRGSWTRAAMCLIGVIVIFVVWVRADGDRLVHWQGLFSALCGMAFGGMLVWLVRLIGSAALGQEAMGYGDVTLMAMIGAFLGWQSTLIIFFLAPFCGVIIALTQWALTGRKDIAYGPFLCLAAAVCVVQWAWLWERYGEPAFMLGPLVPAALFFCLILMGGMLWFWRAVRTSPTPPHRPVEPP